MTKEECNEAAALVVRLRKDLELHTDALKQSNAQCAEYLRQNEQLQAASDEMQNALAEATKDLSYSRLAVDAMCARDKRFTSTAALCGAGANEDIGDFIERTAAERKTLHSELVEVRAALASVTEQRDSLQRTLDEWERADTTPHERIEPPTVPDDLEFREGIPTPAMIAICSWWEVQGRGDVICFKNKDQRPVVWRSLRGDASWQYDDCPQPLKPSKRTWKQLDLLLATAPDDVADHVVPPSLPICTTCHGCGSVLYPSPAGDYFGCGDVRCTRSNTKHWQPGCTIGPYAGPCKSATPVRHE